MNAIDNLDDLHPLGKPGAWRRALPFAAVLAIGVVTVALGDTDDDRLSLAMGVFGIVVAATLLLPWRRLPGVTQLVPPLGVVLVIGVLSYHPGTGYVPLVLVPIVWCALYGTRRELDGTIVASVAAIGSWLATSTAIGGGDVRRVVLWAAVATLTGVTVQGLVTRTRLLVRSLERSERAAAEATSRYAMILENAPLGIWVTDADRRVTFANEHMAELLGYEPAEVLHHHAREFLAEDIEPALLEELRRSESHAVFRTGDLRYRHRDGHEVPVELSAVALFDRDGKRAGALGISRGLAEQRALQADVERSMRRFELIVEHSTDIISILGANGEWLYSSPAGVRLMGYPEGYHPEDGIFALVHPDDVVIAATSLHEVIDGVRSPREPVVFRVRHANGEWRYFETCGVNLLDDPVIHGVLIMSRDVTDRQQLTDLLAHAALHDPLTDLLNRAALGDELRAALARGARTDTAVAACFIDLDNFKPVNDRYGHAVGDEVLVEVARRLRDQVRSGDAVARVGGDEFVVLCEAFVDPSNAARLAERIAVALNEPYESAAGLIECGASIGVAFARPGEEPTQLLARADEALYRAKSAGRRCVSFEDNVPHRVTPPAP